MTQVERDGSDFVVPAALLAEAFQMTEADLRQAMQDGSMTSVCEAGVDSDAGRWRLTFRHASRVCRFTVDETGRVLSSARFPAPSRNMTP
jgi:hypothetical protein